MDIREELCEHHGDDLLFADGYDDAIVGVCGGFDSGRRPSVAFISTVRTLLFRRASLRFFLLAGVHL